MGKDIIKLIITICVVAAIIFAIYSVGKSVDNKNKYKHPITQDGAKW